MNNREVFARAFGLAAVGGVAAALAEFQRIRAERPGDPDAHYNVGLAQTELGDYPSARQSYLAALRSDCRHVPALHNLALVELYLGRRQRAKALLNRVLRIAPGHPWAAINLSDIYAAQKEWTTSQEILSKVLAAQPDSLHALVRLGRLRSALGDEAGAARVFAEAVRLHPGEAVPQTWLGESLRALAEPYRDSE